MRQLYRPAGSTCKVCHPEKMGHERRFREKELAERLAWERERRVWEGPIAPEDYDAAAQLAAEDRRREVLEDERFIHEWETEVWGDWYYDWEMDDDAWRDWEAEEWDEWGLTWDLPDSDWEWALRRAYQLVVDALKPVIEQRQQALDRALTPASTREQVVTDALRRLRRRLQRRASGR